MKNIKLVLLLCLTSIIFGCAHHNDVRPGDDGIHRIVINTDDKAEGARDALRQAEHFCKQFKQYAAVVEEKQDYVGTMDEKDYQTGKKISDVAKVVGGATYTLGGKDESNIGGIVGLGGMAGDAALGKGYNVTMRFKCK